MEHLLGISSTKKVLVVGDAMLDKYTFGSVDRISPEAPVPILKVKKHETRLGGAANVAANIAAVGVGVSLLSLCGDDGAADILLKEIKKADIDSQLIKSGNISTIVKKRLLAQQQQLMRIDHENEKDTKAAQDLFKRFLEIFLDYDLVVLSDYGKGALIDHQSYIENCNKNNIAILVDPKGGNFNRYANSTIITPNLREFEEIVGSSSNDDEFLSKAKKLKDKLSLTYLMVTLGADGVFVLDNQNKSHRMLSEAKQVFDVSGAGDTVIAVLAALIASGYKVVQALDIANIAAGLAVGKVGTSVVTYQEILNSLNKKERVKQPLYDIDELLPLIIKDKSDNKKIVMTNGCFDILHAGHVTYLEEAAKLGDVLVVAINTDASVKRLKGKSRPVNSLKSRARVIAGLQAVDYIISFDEDTPKKIYELTLPDILVKGSDYKDNEIIGADAVIKNGGSVVLIDFVEGYSTTEIIKKINDT